MSDSTENTGPRIGVYYGIVIDQDHLNTKLQPIEFGDIVKSITGVCPFAINAEWKLDYDHSQCCQTVVVYHKEYTKISECPGFLGGWSANGNTKEIPKSIATMADDISTAIEKKLYPQLTDSTVYAILAVGYCAVYLIG
ncbi:Hypothetical protein HVR_LOCUS1209 [uncultured virus]|nr:Hypothetical protein HVR_LOCUS1209 [uncultured virus]